MLMTAGPSGRSPENFAGLRPFDPARRPHTFVPASSRVALGK
jgi:hypothetical protein